MALGRALLHQPIGSRIYEERGIPTLRKEEPMAVGNYSAQQVVMYEIGVMKNLVKRFNSITARAAQFNVWLDLCARLDPVHPENNQKFHIRLERVLRRSQVEWAIWEKKAIAFRDNVHLDLWSQIHGPISTLQEFYKFTQSMEFERFKFEGMINSFGEIAGRIDDRIDFNRIMKEHKTSLDIANRSFLGTLFGLILAVVFGAFSITQASVLNFQELKVAAAIAFSVAVPIIVYRLTQK